VIRETYAAPWSGRTLLACKKCQKKLRKRGGNEHLASLKKAAKVFAARSPEIPRFHILNVGCMDFCPKGRVAVCAPTADGGEVAMLRSVEDLSVFQTSADDPVDGDA
jgi:predicted metal-binding protein